MKEENEYLIECSKCGTLSDKMTYFVDKTLKEGDLRKQHPVFTCQKCRDTERILDDMND